MRLQYGYTDTADNILENEWIPGVGTFILNLGVTSKQMAAMFACPNSRTGACLGKNAYGCVRCMAAQTMVYML